MDYLILELWNFIKLFAKHFLNCTEGEWSLHCRDWSSSSKCGKEAMMLRSMWSVKGHSKNVFDIVRTRAVSAILFYLVLLFGLVSTCFDYFDVRLKCDVLWICLSFVCFLYILYNVMFRYVRYIVIAYVTLFYIWIPKTGLMWKHNQPADWQPWYCCASNSKLGRFLPVQADALSSSRVTTIFVAWMELRRSCQRGRSFWSVYRCL